MSKKYSKHSNTACKRICSASNEFERNCKVFQEQLAKSSYDSASTETEIKKIEPIDRKEFLIEKTMQKAHVFPLAVAYKTNNIKQYKTNNSKLKANKALEKTFSIKPIIAFCKNKIRKQLTGGNTMQYYKKIKKIKIQKSVQLGNLEYGHCVIGMFKTHSNKLKAGAHFSIF